MLDVVFLKDQFLDHFLCVNDIHRCPADNTNILYADKNLKDLETTVNNGL